MNVETLKTEIKNSGLKKTYIAKELGISNVYLSYMLNGDRDLNDNIKFKILKLIKAK